MNSEKNRKYEIELKFHFDVTNFNCKSSGLDSSSFPLTNFDLHSFEKATTMKIFSFVLLGVASTTVSAFAPCLESSRQATTALGVERRNFISSAVVAAGSTLLSAPPAAFAAEDAFGVYKNEKCGFQINVPSGWVKTIQELPNRNPLTLYIDPDSDNKTLMFIALNDVRDDFTSLGSFGSVDQVAQAVILPGGEIKGNTDTTSKMLVAESKNNAYYFDYTTKVADLEEQHYRTIFSLVPGATGGAGSVLVTLTVQTTVSRYDNLKPTFDKVIESYGKMK